MSRRFEASMTVRVTDLESVERAKVTQEAITDLVMDLKDQPTWAGNFTVDSYEIVEYDEATGDPVGRDFFVKGGEYSNAATYQAPEETWYFDCRDTTLTPDGHRIAFGFVRSGVDKKWTATGFGERDWHRRKWHFDSID